MEAVFMLWLSWLWLSIRLFIVRSSCTAGALLFFSGFWRLLPSIIPSNNCWFTVLLKIGIPASSTRDEWLFSGTNLSSAMKSRLYFVDYLDSFACSIQSFLDMERALLCLNKRACSFVKMRLRARLKLAYSLTKFLMSSCSSYSDSAFSLKRLSGSFLQKSLK